MWTEKKYESVLSVTSLSSSTGSSAKGTDIHITGRTWNASNFRSVELSLAPSPIRSLLSYNVIFNYNSDILRILLNFVLKFVDVR